MVFTVSCPECEAEFPVDSQKVPEGGVFAQCSKCPGTFFVEADTADDADGIEDAFITESPDGFESFMSDSTGGDAFGPADDSGFGQGMADDTVEAATWAEAAPAAVADEPASEAEAPTVDPPAFGQTDPDARAARLARVLVSDMKTYNPALYDRAVEGGTLVEDFGDEVKRSWSEYVDQVGEDLARSTPHFARALNDLLAQGEELFDESMFE